MIVTGTVTALTLAYILRIFERPYYVAAYWDPKTHSVTQDDFNSYFNSVWVTIITMTTVGYGDFSAVTVPGRITSIVEALCGAVLISLLVTTMSSHLMLKPEERKVLNHIQE